ncbi:SMR family transporter [soil metagenome]
MAYFYIAATIVLTAYGQLVLKWRLNLKGAMPDAFREKLLYLFYALLDPFVISSFAAAFLASLTWMAALSKFQLSYAYPFMSISFLLVFVLSVIIFGETFNFYKLGGCLLIVAGIVVLTRG